MYTIDELVPDRTEMLVLGNGKVGKLVSIDGRESTIIKLLLEFEDGTSSWFYTNQVVPIDDLEPANAKG